MLIAASLILSVPEVILLLFGAIILGITIHFFITSRRSLKATTKELQKNSLAKDEWKIRYLNDIELKDKEISSLKAEISSLKTRSEEAEENAKIYSIEAEEMRKQNHKLQSDLNHAQHTQRETPPPVVASPRNEKIDYLEQLRNAQSSLFEQNQKINQLLGNIDVIREKEEVHRNVLRDNAELNAQINSLRMELADREKEMNTVRQKEQLAKEMNSMLDNAYNEFNVLQGKIQKLESQLTSSRMMNLEFEDLKEEHSKVLRELEEYRSKLGNVSNESQQLQVQLMEAEDKLREANFQRQQLQKRVAYLEELNNDLQVVSDANKKLENQLRRIGELESMLNVVSEERDILRQKGDRSNPPSEF